MSGDSWSAMAAGMRRRIAGYVYGSESDHEAPLFVEPLYSLEVTEGEAACFTVAVSGRPAPRVTWQHNGIDVVEGGSPYFEVVHSPDGLRHSLRIGEVFADDAGDVCITAENDAGAVSASARLAVRRPNVTSPHGSSVPGLSVSPGVAGRHFVKPLTDENVRQGEKVVLECRLPADRLPDSVQWFCNGVEIAPSPDYVISPCVGGVCRMTICDAFPEDSGSYSCVATFAEEPVITTMSLGVVGELDASQSPRPPMFTTQLTNQCLLPGQTALFECVVAGRPPPEIVWTRRGHPLLDKARYESVYNQYTGSTTLSIFNMRDEDEGEYSCRAFNVAGESTTSAFLLHREHFTDWQQRAGTDDMLLPAPPASHLTYDRVAMDPSKVSAVPEHKLLSPHPGGPAIVQSLDSSAGMTNGGVDSSQLDGSATQPHFDKKLNNCQLVDGTDAVLSCHVTGNPMPNVQWYHGSRLIRPSSKYGMQLSRNGDCVLRIKQATANDVGRYSCGASNVVGRDMCSADVFVEGAELIDSTSYISKEAMNKINQVTRRKSDQRDSLADDDVTNVAAEIFVKPIFHKMPSNLDVAEGQTSRLDSIVIGRPNPEICWYHDGKQVYSDRTHKIVINQDGVNSLIFLPVSLWDSGSYRCVASNGGGEDSFEVSVSVTPRQVQTAPHFLERLSARTAAEGAQVALSAEVVGVPMPNVLWRKDGQQLAPPAGDEKPYRMETDGSHVTLRFGRVAPSDAGWYQCTAMNSAGTATSRAKLTVQTSGIPERHRSLTPDWMHNIPRRLTSDKNLNISSVDNRRLSEPAKSAGGELPVIVPEPTHQTHLERVLSPPKPYSTRMPWLSEQPLPTVDSGPRPSDIVARPASPTVDCPLTPVVVTEGETAKFMVKICGEPSPSVTWYVNNVAIYNSARYMLSYDGLMNILEMRKTRKYDSGTVRVIGKNSLGEVDCSTILTVTPLEDLRSGLRQTPKLAMNEAELGKKESVELRSPELDAALKKQWTPLTEPLQSDTRSATEMPQFVKCLEDVEVIDGQEVMLFCVVKGVPMPTLTWYHNNKNIVENEEYVFTYDRQRGHIYLVILDCLADDEGEFRCVATNTAGQTETRCNLRILPGDGTKVLSAAVGATKALSPASQPLLIKVAPAKRDTVDKTSIVSSVVLKSWDSKPTSSVVASALPAHSAVNGQLVSAESLTLMPPDILFHTKKIPGQSRKVASYRTVLRRASDNDLLGYRAESGDQLHRQDVTWKVSDWSVYAKGTVHQASHMPGMTSQTQSKMPSEYKLLRSQSSLQPTIPSAPMSLQTASTHSFAQTVSSRSKSPLRSPAAKISHVKAAAETSPSFISSRLYEPPRFILPLSNQTVRDGDAAVLRVRFHGNPTPKLRWFFNRKAVENEEDFVIRTESMNGESVLWIKEVFPEDDGEFICKAENDYGTAVTHCRLTVQYDAGNVQLLADMPRMGRRFSETITIDDSHRLQDLMSVHEIQSTSKLEKSEFFVRRTSLPQAVKMDVEIASPPPVNIAEGAAELRRETRPMQLTVPLPAQTRRFSETVVMDLGMRHQSVLEFEFQRPTQPVTTPTAASSKCISRMTFDSKRSKPSTQWMSETSRGLLQELNSRAAKTASTMYLQKMADVEDGTPPYFVIALEPVKVMDGEKARFCALVAGSPKPEVSWLHDGKPVTENPDFHLTYNKQTGSVGLEIAEVFPQDGGHYECVANNVFGTATVSAQLTVEAFEYVADSEEATLSQSESVRSFCSIDDLDFRAKTQHFFEGMARLRQEVEEEQKVEPQKTHTVSRSFYPRRVSDNITHRTNVMLNLSSEPEAEPSGAELYAAFSNRLLLSDFTQAASVDRRRSASSASDKRISQELGQFLRPGMTERSLSVMSTPSTIQRPSSRQSESEESITMVDVTWQHRKPTAHRRHRPRPRLWEETDSETLSLVRTSKLKEKKDEKAIAKQQETIRLRETGRQRSRREEIAKQLEMVEQQERKIKEELAEQQKMLQQLTAERQQEIERERIQDVVKQQELLKVQKTIRRQELARLSELQKQHETAKKLAFQRRQAEMEKASQAEKLKREVESHDEASFITIGISSPVTSVKSELHKTEERSVVLVEAVEHPAPDVTDDVKLHKLKMVRERHLEMPLFTVVESLNVARIGRARFCVLSTFVDDLPNILSFSSPLCMKTAPNRETLESPAAVKCTNIRTVLPASETVMEDGAMVSVAKEIIHSEHVREILTPQDLQVVQLVEESFAEKPARYSQSSEDDVFYDASDVDVRSLGSDVTEAGELIPTGSLLMAPVFELPLADVTAFDGAGAILECRVTGNPTPEVMWFVNGVEIRSMPPEVTVSYHAGLCRLVIVDVMPDDEGEYAVRAINEAGSCLTSAYLTVLPPSGSERASPGTTDNFEVAAEPAELQLREKDETVSSEGMAPKFTTELVTQEVLIGQPVTMSCDVIGTPASDVTWYQDGKKLVPGPNMVIDGVAGQCSLHIRAVTGDDEAEYLCEARNEHGTASTVQQLLVNYEVAEETVIKTKDAAALPAAVPQTQSRSVMPHAAIEPNDVFVEERVVNVVLTVIHCREKSTTLTSEVTVISSSDAGMEQKPAAESAATDAGDAVVDVVASCLLQDQKKSAVEFNTFGQQQREEFELVDCDADLSFCTCAADESEMNVEFVQSDTARICANTTEQSVPCHEEPPVAELASISETENALGSEVPYEFSIAESSHRPETNISEDVCTFLEESAAPEIQELTSENVEEQSEINVCSEMAELREKAVTNSIVQLADTVEESVNDEVEEVPAAEQVEGCEVSSEVVQAELKQKVASETGVHNWTLESDDVDDFFDMAHDGQLSPEEIPQETVVLENKAQQVSSASNQLMPDVFDGATEEISTLETEDAVTPSEIASDEVLLENKIQPVCSCSDQLLLDVFDGATEDTSSLETEGALAPCEIPSDAVVLETKRLESTYTSGQLLTVADEEDQMKEMAQEFDEFSVSPEEVLSEFVVAEAAGLKTMNTFQQEALAEEEYPVEVLQEEETMAAGCDEIQNEFLEPSSMTFSLPHSVCDGVTEVNEQNEYSDVDAVDEEKVGEPEEISSSLISTSVVPKTENLTAELIEKSSFEDTVDDEPDVEPEILPEGTALDSPLVQDETVKVQVHSAQQTSVIQEDSFSDKVDESVADSVEGEVVENLAAEAGSVTDLLQSYAAVVKEEHLAEKFNDLLYDISPSSFVSEAVEDANAVSDSSASMLLPIVIVPSTELISTSLVPKIELRTPERQLSIDKEDLCSEGDGTVMMDEPVVVEVTDDLDTAETASEPEMYEMYVEEEVIVEEKIIESIVTTTVRSEERVAEVQDKGDDICVEAAEAEKTEDISASSMEQRTATAAESAATEAGDLSITVEKKLTSEVTETVTVTVPLEGDALTDSKSPRVVDKVMTQTVSEGDIATFECRFVSPVQPQISWSRNGRQIKSDKKHQVEMAADRGNFWSRLTVYDIQAADAGEFSVSAVNGFGTVTSSASLTLQAEQRKPDVIDKLSMEDIAEEEEKLLQVVEPPVDIDASEAGTSEHEATVKVDSRTDEAVEGKSVQKTSAAAQFEQELGAIVTKEGQQTTYSQSVSVDVGQPITLCSHIVPHDAEITWSRNRVSLNDSRCHLSHDKSSGEVQLSIEKSFVSDSGVYAVHVGSGSDRATSRIKVDVISDRPVFVQGLTDQMVVVGQPATFTALVHGIPRPQIRWFFGGVEVVTTVDKYNISCDDTGRVELHIVVVSSSDIGQLCECKASSDAGEAISAASLMPAAEPPVVLKGLDNCQVSERVPAKFSANITGVPRPTVAWFINNIKLKPSEGVVVENVDEERLFTFTLTLVGDMRRRTGRVKLIAKNVAGDATTEADLSISGTPPMFMEYPYISEILESQTTIFRCYVAGDPRPTVEWSCGDWRPVMSRDRVRKYVDADGSDVMELDDARCSDAGEYTVTASNELGSCSATVTLVVNVDKTAPTSRPEPLQDIREVEEEETLTTEDESTETVVEQINRVRFVRGLVNVDVMVGQRVVLSCETSEVTASVDWHKNDEHLSRDGGFHGYEMLDSGRVHSLTIHTASLSDEAKYTCSCRDDVTSCLVLVEECKHDAVEPPVDEVAEQSQQLVQVAAGEQSAGESTIVAQLHHIEQAEAAHSSAVAASVEHTEQLVLVKRPPGELLAADTAQQATATIEVEQSRSVAQMPGLETASAASGDEGFKTVDSQLSVDHREWTTRLPARRMERSGIELGVSTYLEEHMSGLTAELRHDMVARSSLDDYEASSLQSYSYSELSFADSHSATKPWFIRKLPSRLEVIEGRSFSVVCRTSGVGCRPWFVKRLPARVEVERGHEISMDCTVSNVTEESLEVGARSTSWILEQKMKKGVQGAKPLPPSSLFVTYLGTDSVVIEWTKPYSDGDGPLLHYVLEKRDSGKSTWEHLTDLPPDVTECELDNMATNKVYYMRVRAANQFGLSDPRDLDQPIKMKGDRREAPSRPGYPRVVEQTDDSVTLCWEGPASDGGCPLLQYIIERREMRGPRWVRVQKSAVVSPPHTATDLLPASCYQFRVYACNAVGVSEPSQMSKVVTCSKTELEPAQFMSQIQDVTVEEGEKATFECYITGSPMPEVRWFKNSRELFDGYKHHIQMEYVETGVLEGELGDEEDARPELSVLCQLVVNNVMSDDCGEVECRAFNSGGMDSTTAQLYMRSAAQVRLTPRIYDGMAFSQGQTMNVRVPVVGQPVPRVTWIKDGEELLTEAGRREVWMEDSYAVLNVTQCRRSSDRGVYGIRVENSLGSDQATFTVEITDCPSPPSGRPKVSRVTSASCHLDWDAPADDGGSPVTSYVIERLTCGSEGDGRGLWQTIGRSYVRHMVVWDLVDGQQYQFRVAAENMFGKSVVGEESEVVIASGSTEHDGSTEMNYDSLVMSDLLTAHVKIDVDKMKTELDLHKKYIICEQLGRGSFGVIHRTIERATGRNWAAKFVACTTIERAMVRGEIDIRNDLRHPNLLQLHEAFETHGEIAFIIELVSGVDLLSRIVEMDDYSELQCIGWLRQICQGVAHMHKNNIIHLDIRPENVLFTTSKSHDVKIVDFSVAQRVDPNRTVRVLFSTIEYCSAEVLTFAPISYSTDIWTLGVLAAVLLTGISPFRGRTTDETYLNITQATSPSLSAAVWQSVSDYAKDWISKLLVKDSKKRMSISEALAHPWLSGEAESVLSFDTLAVDGVRAILSRQKWRAVNDDKLGIGCLAHEGAIFLKLSQEGIEMERELFMELPDQRPQVVVELANTVAYEGTVGRFRCRFQGQPEPQVKWYHEDVELDTKNEKYNFWYKHGLAMMNIHEVEVDDVGQYACVATNRLGSSTTVGELNIQEMASRRGMEVTRKLQRSVSCERESSAPSDSRRSFSFERQTSVDRLTNTSGSLSGSVNESYSSGYASYSVKSAPQFTLPLIDQLVCVGHKCVFSVLLSTKPDIEIAWYHGQSKVSLTDDVRYRMDSENCMYRLVIMGITVNDAGDWRCLATNTYGQCISACRLDVVDAVREGARRPEFTQNLSRTIVVEGSPTKLECKVSGWPVPDVRWLKDRRSLGDDVSYEMTCEEDELHTLCISATYPEHIGWYSCVARNDVGTAITEAKLTVERADCESLISANSSFDRASLVDDLESVQTRTSMASLRRRRLLMTTSPQFSARLRPKRCVVGQTIRFSCCVSGLPEPNVTWSRADGTTITNGKRLHITNNFGLCSLEITAARLEDSGLYIVKASNVEGQITCSASLQVEHDADGKQASCSRESTPLHAASLSIPAQQFDQSQEGHLSQAPVLPGVDAFSTAEAGQYGVSCLPESGRFTSTKDSTHVLESQPVDAALSIRLDNVEHQRFPDTALSPPRVVEERREGGSVDVQSARLACQETRTTVIQRKLVSSVLDDISESRDCAPVASWSELTQPGHVRLEGDSNRPAAAAASAQQTVEAVVVSAAVSHQQTDVDTAVQSQCLDVTSSPTLQHVASHSLTHTDSKLPPANHQLTSEVGHFVQPITDQVVGAGETATFQCCLRHHSSSCDVTWWRDDWEILSGGRMRVTATDDGVRHCLVINDVEQSDAGQYVVKLTDRHDDALVQSLSAKLVVIPRPRTAADGASGATLALCSQRLSASDTARLRFDHVTDTKSAVDKDDVVHGSSTPPPARDVTNNDVTGDVRGKMADDWMQLLVDASAILSRFITLEYFSDGAALTKALWLGRCGNT